MTKCLKSVVKYGKKWGIRCLEIFEENLVKKFVRKFDLKSKQRNKVDKLWRTFSKQIVWMNLIEKLVEKLGDKLCGQIVWNLGGKFIEL